jgi:hypothetical protein
MENDKIDEIVEDFQEQIVNAGGKFFRQKELKEMELLDLLKILVPNQIEITVNAHRQKQ